ncbi:HPr kinase/phosphatase C-terminal domain-containing protein [Sphingomonas donggukensis]|uniref:HPr kinase/phosphatase C-terminal domain-containing protein n=1 Tax=Sphingomonas donggukensis TaxID=2949093 RepID=A0ABY4TXK9_9SPHN|nr:HPr kinase/phosphatase C-terminal domain-containing protein [Sphingomonas donggukensis]URW77138.1 HPr kinase/phosphatase C-terminal domain-containing protein [Sphingomonas donggukensis]
MMAELSSETIHASCVAIDGVAVLIEGRSGAGKSDLALRLMDRGAVLVSDDYTRLVRQGKTLIARAPDNLAGKIEVRGIGIVEMPHIDDVPVGLIVAIVEAPPRMPGAGRLRRLAGVELREIALPSLEPSAPIKVEIALKQRRADA